MTLSPYPHAGSAGRRVGALVVAAGHSRRMGDVDKVFYPVAGRPLIAYPLQALEECLQVDSVALVLAPEALEQGRRLVEEGGWRKVQALCPGGERRQDSVRCGLERLEECSWVVVHDGARPCLTPDLVQRGLEAAQETGAAVAAVPVTDTIKVVGDSDLVVDTPPRERLWAVQTPQVFDADLLRRAHREVVETVTDDAAMVERLGYRVKVFMGSYANVKVTTPEDLALVEALLKANRQRRASH